MLLPTVHRPALFQRERRLLMRALWLPIALSVCAASANTTNTANAANAAHTSSTAETRPDEAGGQAPRLLVMGDSISAEYGLARGQGWVALMEQRLKEENTAVQVVNASISGETTSGARARLAALLKAHQPRYVVIGLGGNDALRGLALQHTRENLAAMVDAAHAVQARVLLLGIQVPPNYGAQYSRDFAAVFTQVAADKDVLLVPFMLEAISDAADVQTYFQADRIHPNAQAQPLILQTLWPQLQKLLAP